MPPLALANASVRTFGAIVAKLFRGIRSAYRRSAAMIAEERIHKARLEAEMFRNRCRLRTKTDDDLPAIP